jgi:hypothetical protein
MVAMSEAEPEPVSLTGAVAANFHEGSRSEYLAQFAFSAFGTAVTVPHQEDSGIDVYCTLLERDGQRAWPRAYFSVQVKSTMSPWVFGSSESVRWIIEHPLPIFLCVVQKADARLLVYHTTPRFAVWALPTHPDRLELIPGTAARANTIAWATATGHSFTLEAPILNFTIEEVLEDGFRRQAAEVLKFWIDYDVENLLRIRSGIHQFRVPVNYETNTTNFTGWTQQSGGFRDESLQLARRRLQEMLGLLATHHFKRGEMVSAAIYAMALRQLQPAGWSTFNPHDGQLHLELNRRFGLQDQGYMFSASDALMTVVKDELARHGITEPSSEEADEQ